jgi:hypothetical protein
VDCDFGSFGIKEASWGLFHGKLLNLFPYDHLRLKKYGLCLILLFSPPEEVYGKLGFDVW